MSSQDDKTIDYYNQNAAAFVRDTVGALLEPMLARFAQMLPAGGAVLDWGCGSGRDSRALREMGFVVTSVDASPAMAEEALAATGTVVRVEQFRDLAEVGAYDGIWASASLLHVPPEELPQVLDIARRALGPGGVLYCSFKYGEHAGPRNGRWFTDQTEDSLRKLLEPGFDIVDLWATGDVRPGRGDERWLNCLATKRW